MQFPPIRKFPKLFRTIFIMNVQDSSAIRDIHSTNSDQDSLKFDQALERVGASHYYQKRAFVVFGMQWFFVKYSFYIQYPHSWILFSTVFLFRDPQPNCNNNQVCLAACKDGWTDSCEKFICSSSEFYQFVKGPYATTAFDQVLSCKKSILAFLKSTPYVGSLIGFFIFSFVGDNYGRRLSLILSWFITSLGGIILGLSQNFSMIAIGLFLAGFGGNPSITIHYSFINEHTTLVGHFRDIQNVGVQVFFVLGEFAIITIAYFFENWRVLSLFWIAVPLLAMNFSNLLIVESPQFLYSKSKRKCVKALNSIALVNGKPKLQMSELEDNPQMRENNRRVYSIVDLFRYASLRFTFIAGFSLFFGIQVIYYGISFVSDQLGLNFFLAMYIVAFCELIAYVLTGNSMRDVDLFVAKLERKKWIVVGFVLIGVMCVPFIFHNQSVAFKITQGILAGIMRFVICVVWALAYVYVSELFPTVVRSLALGLISAGGSIGSILQTFLINFSNAHDIHPLVTLGVVGVVTGLLVIPLRETFGQPLLEKIPEDDTRIRQSQAQNNNQEERDDSSYFMESKSDIQ